MSRGTRWALIAAFTILAGLGGWVVGTQQTPDPLPVGDRVQAAVEGLRRSNVYVAPEATDLLSDQDRARLAARAAASRPEAFIIVWDDTSEGGFYLPSEGLRQIGAELGKPGYYVSLGRGDVSSADIGIKGDYVRADNFDSDTELTPGVVAERTTQILAENDGRDFSEGNTTGSNYWGGTGGTIAAGLLIGVLAGLALAIVLVVLWFAVRSRLRSRP